VRASVRLDTSSDQAFDASDYTANHTRALHYVRGKVLWLVVDRMEFDRGGANCSWSTKGAFLWSSGHAHPNTTVNATCSTPATLSTQQRCLASVLHKSGNASLGIAMDTDVKAAVFNSSIVSGINGSSAAVTGPPQGWYSPRYGTIMPSPVLKITSAGSVCNGGFAPDNETCPNPSPNVRTRQIVTVAWALAATDTAVPPPVSLELLESDESSATLRVETPSIRNGTFVVALKMDDLWTPPVVSLV
jgi:hypothetical protein